MGKVIYLKQRKFKIPKFNLFKCTPVLKTKKRRVKFAEGKKVLVRHDRFYRLLTVMNYRISKTSNPPMTEYLLTDLKWYLEPELEEQTLEG